jgi:hypothetical protein
VARGLAVVCREPEPPAGLAGVYLGFVEQAQRGDGRFHNRRSAGTSGAFTDEVGSDDSQGRALYGLGVAFANSSGDLAGRALRAFESGAPAFDSPSPRANAWAAIGAAEVEMRQPANAAAAALFARTRARLGAVANTRAWPWPEARLAYDNARLAEARIACGVAFDEPALLEEGLALLRWLAAIELREGHFSFAPVGGWASGEPRPGFDQQPIEAGAMADACLRAFEATGDEHFAELCELTALWFLGANDIGTVLLDEATGGCCDGLERNGRNENQGAESTLAALSALQAAARSARSSSSVETLAAPTARSAAPYVM